MNKTLTASIRITGKSSVNAIVKFRAGKEVLLEDGFESGTNFIAEIIACIAEKEMISSKRNESDVLDDSQNITEVNNVNQTAKVYPTVIVEDKLTIETIGLDSYNYALINTNGKIIAQNEKIITDKLEFKIKNLGVGFYFLKIYSKEFQKTFKIIKQ